MEKEPKFSSSERTYCRTKHVSLTHWMRSGCHPYVIKSVVLNCDVSPNVGVLPPELRAMVPHGKLGEYTAQFHEILSDFVVNNYYKIKNAPEYKLVPLNDASDLFGTHCTAEYCGPDANGRRKWHGSLGMVCRISFPQINADYALKIFYAMPTMHGGHGMWFEIPTAFAANHSEPRDNAPIYLASFMGDGYMLSKWCWQKSDSKNFYRNNENEIFATNKHEFSARNFAQGRRIDYGKTYRTMYGAAPYRVRKLVRIINGHIKNGDDGAIRQIFCAMQKNQMRDELNRAMEIISITAYVNSQHDIQKFLSHDCMNGK